MTESRTHEHNGTVSRAAHLGWRWLWRTVATVLIGAAVLLTIARLLLPFAGEYRAELEDQVERYLGYEVEVGQLDIDWHGLGPRLQITDLRVYGPGPARAPIHFDRAYIRLRPVLRDGLPSLRLDDFSVAGFTLRLRRDEQGWLHAFGMTLDPAALGAMAAAVAPAGDGDPVDAGGQRDPAGQAGTGERADGSPVDSGMPAAVPEALLQVLTIQRLQASEATLTIEQPDGEVVNWGNLSITLRNSGRDHSIAVSVTPPSSVAEQLTGQLEFVGAPSAYRDWRASLYLEARALSLEQAAGLWPDAPVRARGGRLDGRIWSEWDGGRLQEARGEVDADEIVLAGSDQAMQLERIAGRVRLWQPRDGQWQIDVADLEVSRDGRSWTGERWSYALEDDRDWRVAADFARAEDIVALARVLPLDDSTRARLQTHSPRGDIRDLNLAMASGGEFRLRGDFRDLGWAARGDIPGLTGLDGRLLVRSDGGHVILDAGDVQFDAPKLFRAPLRVRQLEATVALRPTTDGFHLYAPDVDLHNKDLRGRGRVRVDLARGRSPRLDLQFEYRDGVGTAVPAYLPAGIMPPPVVEWLDQAFRAGRVPSGSFILRGSADDFPYRQHDGRFDVRFDMVDTTLHYADGWPAIENLSGQVRFSGPALDIRATRGGTRDLRLEAGHARFDDLEDGQLEVALDAVGPLDDMLAVVADSPLGPRFEPVLEGTRASGNGALSLALSVPVETPGDTRVNGQVQLDGAGLSQARNGIEFDRIRGTVGFTQESVRTDDLVAELRGRPVRVNAATRNGVAAIRLEGRFAPGELVPALAGGALSGSGRSDWRVDIDVPLRGETDARLLAISDLVGTGIQLPAPIGKSPQAERPVRVELPFGGDEVHVRYGADTRIVLALRQGSDPGVRSVGVAFGESARLPRRDGLRVAGAIDVLPLGGWLALANGDDQSDPAFPPLVELELSVGVLELSGYRLSEVRLNGREEANGAWNLALASSEADGRLRAPATGGGGPPVEIRFDLVDFALIRPREEDATEAAAIDFDDPASLPPLDIRIERLKFDDFTLNDVSLLTARAGGGMAVHQIGFRTPHLEANGQGNWHGRAETRTDLRLVIRSGDFGAGLEEIGRGGMVRDGDGKVTVDIGWPGLPWAPSLATVTGDVDIDIEDGVLSDVDPGAARLLGLFSLEAMPFRSLLQSGLIFGEMKGRVDLADGNAYTRLLKIESAVGLIKISGRTGLVERDYDQRMVVQPNLSTSLPVIGFLSGGPIAGAAIALIQGVMRNVGGDIEKASEIEYVITGSWDEPVVERVDVKPSRPGGAGDGPSELPR